MLEQEDTIGKSFLQSCKDEIAQDLNIKIPKYSEFLSLKLKMILVKNNTTPQFSLHQTSHLTPSIQSYMALSEFVWM